MTVRFIDPADRLALTIRPQRAIHCWQDDFDSGQRLYKRGMWAEALPHAGRAFEISELLLLNNSVESSNGREIFTASAALLIDTLGKLGELQMIQHIHWQALQWLKHDLQLKPQAQPTASPSTPA